MRKMICVLLFLAVPALAATRDSILVSVPWLAAHLNDPNLVLLHVGDPMNKKEYAAQHIPGAVQVGMEDVSISDHTPKGLMLEMPPAEDLRARLEALGISDNSRIVVYFGKDWVSPATRIVFTLDYAGLGDRASLLDGGMPAWVAAGHEVTDKVPVVKKGTLSPLKINPIVVNADYVLAHLKTPGYSIVDGRDAAFYDGVRTGRDHAGDQRTGHVAGAKSVPFTAPWTDQNHLKPADELRALFTKAGVKPDDTIIGYCHIGQQATAMLFAARSLGYRVLLYDGSYQDWSRRADMPVENPSEKTK